MTNDASLIEQLIQKKRAKTGAVLLLLGIVVALTLLSFIASHWYAKQAIKSVKVSGNAMLTSGDVNAIIDKNIMNVPTDGINLASLRKKLMSNEFIADADVWFNSKAVLGIDIKERVPIGILLNADGTLAYIDNTGAIFSYRLFKNYTDMPVITNAKDNISRKGAVDIISELQNIPSLYNIVSEIKYNTLHKTYSLLLTENNISVALGRNENIAEKLLKFNIFWKNKLVLATDKNSYKHLNASWENIIINE
ncbi:MAG: cell division protein FtsQ/DivIB [Ignavibacteria bacterium]|jgi:cell division protein FtsQ|nr:cell division protein FtsQ/DivIB [Ignavibacteria bacterium]